MLWKIGVRSFVTKGNFDSHFSQVILRFGIYVMLVDGKRELEKYKHFVLR